MCGEEIIFRYVNGSPKPIHVSGNSCRGYKISENIPKVKKITKNIGYDWIYSHIKKIEDYPSYVNPNVECRCCGELIHFYQSPYGGKVFFESPLGPPWKKHCCDSDAGCCVTQGDSPKKSNLTNHSDNERKLIEGWEVYILIQTEKYDINKKSNFKTITLKKLKNEHITIFNIHRKVDIKDNSLVFLKKLCDDYWELSFYKKEYHVDEILVSLEQNTERYYEKLEKYFPFVLNNLPKIQSKIKKKNKSSKKRKSKNKDRKPQAKIHKTHTKVKKISTKWNGISINREIK
jgi:hypothetical protein